ncbi:unnamed protein product [Polarella glacialis]|uniref:Uncharacterized protein n=1 Tax=Polarella glacialis TaxID=89957 RepID=A0A813LX01_POLGL|nr:unnamed protein product [Polarella glacialis]
MGPTGLSAELVELLQETYRTPRLLHGAVDGKTDAEAVIRELAGSSSSEIAISIWAAELWRNFRTIKRITDCSRGELAKVPLKASDLYSQLAATSLVLVQKHFRSSLAKKLAGASGEFQRLSIEEHGRIRWALALAEFIREASLPAVKAVNATASPLEAWKRIFGSRRAKTLRNRVKTWAPINLHRQPVAGGPGMARSVPDSIAAALAVLESAGQVSEEHSISMDSFWKSTVAAWKTALESGAPPKVQAEATPVSVIIATELFVMDTLEPHFLRPLHGSIWSCIGPR